MWTLKVWITGLLLANIFSPGAALAQKAQQDMTFCILGVIDDLAKRDQVVSARGIMATCACLANRKAERLNNQDCPRYSATSEEVLKKIYPSW